MFKYLLKNNEKYIALIIGSKLNFQLIKQF